MREDAHAPATRIKTTIATRNATWLAPANSSMPTGFVLTETPVSSGPGVKAHIREYAAIITPANQATGCQRLDGSRPSGNSRKPNVSIRSAPRLIVQTLAHAINGPPGSEPGLVTNAYWAY